uniref:Bm12093 n=1 Tax=Brugia malayi TaxID=6279 RepID=A0A1I9GAS3_BRUMA|nr:Bm12093 [Brugia malayi]
MIGSQNFENFKLRIFDRLLTWEPDDVLNTFIIPNGENHQVSNDGTHQIVFSSSGNDALFTTVLVRCIVQLELVDAVNSIIFGQESVKKDEAKANAVLSIVSQPESYNKPTGQELRNGDFKQEVVDNVENGTLESTDGGLYKYIGTIL